MTKRDFVTRVLIKLEKHWMGATYLIDAIERDEIRDEGYDQLYDIISDEIKFVDNRSQKNNLINSARYLSRIKEIEHRAEIEESDDLVDMENLIEKI